jgi:hypothetical protein
MCSRAVQLEKLAAAATKGPWRMDRNSEDDLASVVMADGEPVALISKWTDAVDGQDAEFIAAARTAVPELAGMVRDLAAIAEAARPFVDGLDHVDCEEAGNEVAPYVTRQEADALRAALGSLSPVSEREEETV